MIMCILNTDYNEEQHDRSIKNVLDKNPLNTVMKCVKMKLKCKYGK